MKEIYRNQVSPLKFSLHLHVIFYKPYLRQNFLEQAMLTAKRDHAGVEGHDEARL